MLIVEDEIYLRKLLLATLEGSGHEILEAGNGLEALALARAHRPEVILLDVMMPGTMNGLDVCRQIRSDPDLDGCHVVLLTALGQEADRVAGEAAGADAYVVKPFSPAKLLETIRAMQSPLSVR